MEESTKNGCFLLLQIDRQLFLLRWFFDQMDYFTGVFGSFNCYHPSLHRLISWFGRWRSLDHGSNNNDRTIGLNFDFVGWFVKSLPLVNNKKWPSSSRLPQLFRWKAITSSNRRQWIKKSLNCNLSQRSRTWKYLLIVLLQLWSISVVIACKDD